MYGDLEASDSRGANKARRMLEARLESGAQKQSAALVHLASQGIKDRLVPPKAMQFVVDEEEKDISLSYLGDTVEPNYTIHPHALRQMSKVTGLPYTYVTKLRTSKRGPIPLWQLNLLCENYNTLFHRGSYLDRRRNPAKFLHRSVNGEIRGFLSRTFNRRLSSLNLMQPFVTTCKEYSAICMEGSTSAVRVNFKAMLPFVFEPIGGEFVALGVSYSNSDFGAGKLKISGTCMRISAGTTSILDDSLSRVHLGSIIQESDLELSEDTEDKELAAVQSAVRDSVRAQLGVENVNKMLAAIKEAHDSDIPWHKLKSVLSTVLNKKEVDNVKELLDNNGNDIVDLPPVHTQPDGTSVATPWWASNVLSWMASKETSDDRKVDLQMLAGSLVEIK